MSNRTTQIEKLKKSARYSGFKFLDTPVICDEYFKGRNYEIVQLHDMTPIADDDIIGFAGVVKWENDKLSPLDGDSYTAKMPVWGFSEFEDNGKLCLDILVEEW